MESLCSGLRVLDFSQGMAGPLVGMLLADHGADVLKVEPPAGDWARLELPGFHMWNRGKRSIVFDLGDARDRASALELALSADVLIESFRAGHAARLGLDAASVMQHNDRAIYCSISAFGNARRYEGAGFYEGIVSAKCGRMLGTDSMSGAVVPDSSSRPVFSTSPFNTYGASMLALEGIFGALTERAATGKGRHVSTSLLDGANGAAMRLRFERDGSEGIRQRSKDNDLIYQGILVTFMTAECSDGRFVQMCARQDTHFRNWLRALDLEYLLSEGRYARAPMGFRNNADIREMESLLRSRMKQKTRDEWMRIFIAGDVGADPFLTPAEFLEHPQMTENGRVIEIQDPDLGTVRQLGPLVRADITPANISRPAPRLGADQGALSGISVRWKAECRAQQKLQSSVGGHRTNPESSGEARRPLPLAGFTIIEFASFLAGPLGPTLLAELGARIIKVEPLNGDAFRRTGLEFVHLATAKESIAVDLKSVAGREIVRRLVAKADGVVHNFRAGAVEKLGLSFESLCRINPRLVYVHAASYGSKGAQSERAAFHSTPQALCGAGIVQAGRGNRPVDDSYPDPCAGMAVAVAMAMGLYARKRFGVGQYLETTMLTSAGYVNSNNLVLYDGAPPLRIPDAGQHGLGALHRLYRCKTGWLFLGIVQEKEWRALAKSIGMTDWLEDPRFRMAAARHGHDDLLAGLLSEVFAALPSAQWESLLNGNGVPAAVADHGQFEEFLVLEKLVRPIDHPGFDPYWGLNARVRFAGSAERGGLPCALGEHSDAILTELGFDSGERDAFAREGVIKRPPVPAALAETAGAH